MSATGRTRPAPIFRHKQFSNTVSVFALLKKSQTLREFGQDGEPVNESLRVCASVGRRQRYRRTIDNKVRASLVNTPPSFNSTAISDRVNQFNVSSGLVSPKSHS